MDKKSEEKTIQELVEYAETGDELCSKNSYLRPSMKSGDLSTVVPCAEHGSHKLKFSYVNLEVVD